MASRIPSRKSPARKSSGAKPKTAARPARKSPLPARRLARPINPGLSLDRKLDIVGVIMALVGLLTLLSMASGTQGSLAGFWLGFLGRLTGWGMFVLPLALLVVGVWLVLRNFERVPTLSLERLFGLLLVFAILLTLLHFFAVPGGGEAAYTAAAAGQGGGAVGAILLVFLLSALGSLGMTIILFAGLVVALAMILDVPILDLFRWLRPLILRLEDAWDEWRASRKTATPPVASPPAQAKTPSMPEPPPQDGLTASPPAISASRKAVAEVKPTTLPAAASAEAPSPVWLLPQVAEMLDEGVEATFNDENDKERARVIEETLASFGAPAQVVEISRGPTITQFGVEPDFIETRNGRTRVRVGKIASLADDLSLALAASRIRIQAPVPGKGYVGVEVPNEQIAVVALRDVIESAAFTRLTSPLRFALGQDVAGHAVAADLAMMPHLLIAGATGTGKSVFVNSLIACLLLHNTPATLRFIMVDPKRVELTGYAGIPHLLAPPVVEIDRVVGVLQWLSREMDGRYHKFAGAGARNLEDYNARMAAQGGKPLPYLVLVIDELADMMMVAPDQTERLVTRMAQLARATGIHLVISTQRPSVDVVTGLIKANFPSRISFAVASGTDSRVVLDQPGAERLLGRGDMLFQAPDAPAPVRLQGVFVSEPELLRIVQYWRGFAGTASTAPFATSTARVDAPAPNVPLKQIPIWEDMKEEEHKDTMFDEAVDLVRRQGRASISMLQRRMRIGYTRAARLIDLMEEKGIVGPAQPGSQTREIVDYGPAAPPVDGDA